MKTAQIIVRGTGVDQRAPASTMRCKQCLSVPDGPRHGIEAEACMCRLVLRATSNLLGSAGRRERACDMEAIRAIPAGHGVPVLEDAAHALPATHRVHRA